MQNAYLPIFGLPPHDSLLAPTPRGARLLPQGGKKRLLLITCPPTDSPPPPAFLHVKTGFLPPPPSPFRYRWHRRAASEPALLFCTTGRRLKIWKARGQRAISLGKQGKRFPSLPSTCLWVTQPLSAKLRPARLAVGACPVPKSRPTVTS